MTVRLLSLLSRHGTSLCQVKPPCPRWSLQTLWFPPYQSDLLSCPWNLVLFRGQDIGPGPFHLQPSKFFLSPLDLPPPSAPSCLDAAGFLSWKLTTSCPGPHPLPHRAEWRQMVPWLKIWAWHATSCRRIWTSVAFSLPAALGCPPPCSNTFLLCFVFLLNLATVEGSVYVPPFSCVRLLRTPQSCHWRHADNASGSYL